MNDRRCQVSQAEALEAASQVEKLATLIRFEGYEPFATLINYVRGLVEDETRAVAEPRPEPLLKLLDYAQESDDCWYGTLSTSIVRELVNEALAAVPHPVEEARSMDYGMWDVGPVEEAPAEPSPEARDAWISVKDRVPEDGQTVAFVVDCKNPNWDHLDGRVLGGRYSSSMEAFSVPGVALEASHWMPLPPSPIEASKADRNEGTQP